MATIDPTQIRVIVSLSSQNLKIRNLEKKRTVRNHWLHTSVKYLLVVGPLLFVQVTGSSLAQYSRAG